MGNSDARDMIKNLGYENYIILHLILLFYKPFQKNSYLSFRSTILSLYFYYFSHIEANFNLDLSEKTFNIITA
jgi:hypothetical protein